MVYVFVQWSVSRSSSICEQKPFFLIASLPVSFRYWLLGDTKEGMAMSEGVCENPYYRVACMAQT